MARKIRIKIPKFDERKMIRALGKEFDRVVRRQEARQRCREMLKLSASSAPHTSEST